MPIEVTLPVLHRGQVKIWNGRGKFNAVRCGRRFGKTKMLVTLGGDAAAKGRKTGIFTPEHKQWSEPYSELLATLAPIKLGASKTEGVIRTTTGGVVDFWSLNDNELAGRGREYDLILIDEAAYTKDSQMMDIWDKSIRPTMLTRPKATAWAFSTPNGIEPLNFFWKLCNDEKLKGEFREHYAPSGENPLVTPEELERHRRNNHPLIFEQEYLAQFVDLSGDAFFSRDKLLEDGKPVDVPAWCDQVGLVIDTALKGGKEHDGTAAVWFAYTERPEGHARLIILDWDIVQIDGALLEALLPQWLERGAEWGKRAKALYGFTGAWIEDAEAGAILLQQGQARGWPIVALPADLTQAGKDLRAVNASSPVWRGDVKVSVPAYEKRDVSFKGATRNHFMTQVTSFRVGDKQAATRADDLLDCFCYSVAITLGNSDGYA
jgi:hypothetical protein